MEAKKLKYDLYKEIFEYHQHLKAHPNTDLPSFNIQDYQKAHSDMIEARAELLEFVQYSNSNLGWNNEKIEK